MVNPKPSPATAIAIGGVGLIVAALPAMLAGALAVELTQALSFSAAGLGTLMAIHHGFAAAIAAPVGSLVDRLGAWRSTRLAMIFTAVTALSIAVLAHHYLVLVLLVALSGVGKRLMEPASNRLLVRAVNARRLGVAFGIKQSAPPAATMLAGLSVPLIVVFWGWRASFFLGGAAAVVLAMLVWTRASRSVPPARAVAIGRPAASSAPATSLPVDEASDEPADKAAAGHVPGDVAAEPAAGAVAGQSGSTRRDRWAFPVLTVAFAFANAASVTIPSFFVASAAAAGATQSTAGTMLAAASIGAIIARLALGLIADRLVRAHLDVCAAMLSMGVVGFALLATGDLTLMMIGVVLGLSGGWGYNGVFWFTMVRAEPDAAGKVTGRLSPGALLANTISPLLFGVVVERFGYGPAWVIGGTAALLAAVGMAVGGRMMLASRRR